MLNLENKKIQEPKMTKRGKEILDHLNLINLQNPEE